MRVGRASSSRLFPLPAGLVPGRRRAGARPPAAEQELIQVCADVSAPETRARALRALTAAAKEHPQAALRLLVLDRDAVAVVGGVEVEPVYEWLLAARDDG